MKISFDNMCVAGCSIKQKDIQDSNINMLWKLFELSSDEEKEIFKIKVIEYFEQQQEIC